MLEDLLVLILEEIPGIEIVERNQLTSYANEEVDVSAYNNKDSDGLPFFPNFIFVECKNWSSPVGSSEIRDFTRRLQQRGLDHGILIATHGITGDQVQRTAAQHELGSALQEGIRILVITREDLLSINIIDDFVELLKRKICKLIVSISQ